MSQYLFRNISYFINYIFEEFLLRLSVLLQSNDFNLYAEGIVASWDLSFQSS